MNRNTEYMDYIETIDLPCVAEIQTMGCVMIPSNVVIDRIIIEPRDNPHLGHYRLIITIDGNLIYSDETPVGRYSIDVEDRTADQNGPRQLIAVIVPQDIPPAVRSYLHNENLQITVIGSHRSGTSDEDGNTVFSPQVEIATIHFDELDDSFDSDWTRRWV